MGQKQEWPGQLGMRQPVLDTLEQAFFHRLMMWLYRPAFWSIGQVAVGVMGLLLAVGLVWGWLMPAFIPQIPLLMLLFHAADAALLLALPRLGLSFGEWRSHLFVLGLPRALVAVMMAVAGHWFGAEWGLGLLLLGQIAGTLLTWWGSLVEPFRLQLTHLEIELPGWDTNLPPVRLLHVSDLHLERLTRREGCLLQLAAATQAEALLFTGDFLNLSYVYDEQARQGVTNLLQKLAAHHAIFAVLGSPPVDVRGEMPAMFQSLPPAFPCHTGSDIPSLLADQPLTLLRRHTHTLHFSHNRQLTLIGLDCTHDLPYDRALLAHLVGQTNLNHPCILLYHSPELFPEAVQHGLTLHLCGHTHGGQVRLPLFGAVITSSQLGKQFEMGLYRRGNSQLYVSRGVGLEGMTAPRIRILCPPEMTLVTLRGAGNGDQGLETGD